MNEIKILKKVLEIYSPTGQERKLAEFLLSLANNGRIDGVGNSIVEKGYGNETLLLCSHMDTVPGKIPVRIEENKLYGRGAVDAKGSLVAMFLAFLKSDVKNIRVVFAGVVDEEEDSKGIRYLMKSLHPDWAVFGEPSGVNKITIGYMGGMKIKLTFYGESGHLANPLTKNAVEETIRYVHKLRSKHNQINYNNLTVRPSKIQGSVKECEVFLHVKIPLGMNKKDVLNTMDVDNTQIIDYTPPFEINPRNRLVINLKRAIKRVTGKGAKLNRKTGTGDMNILSDVCKNCVTYGPGDSRLDHTDNEHIDINEFLTSMEVYRKFIEIVDNESKNN